MTGLACEMSKYDTEKSIICEMRGPVKVEVSGNPRLSYTKGRRKKAEGEEKKKKETLARFVLRARKTAPSEEHRALRCNIITRKPMARRD